MRRIIFIGLLAFMFILPCFAIQSGDERELSRTRDYTDAILKKTPLEKIKAFKAYIQKYPDTSQKFTKLAYYMLTVNYFHNKNYRQTLTYGQKTLKLGEMPSRGEQARLYLVVGNAYGIKDTSFYNKDKALEYTNKAISLARGHDNEVLKAAKNLKNKLTAPPAKKITPEQTYNKLIRTCFLPFWSQELLQPYLDHLFEMLFLNKEKLFVFNFKREHYRLSPEKSTLLPVLNKALNDATA